MIKGIRLNFSSPKIESSGTYLLREGDKQLGSCLSLPAAPKFIPMTKINHLYFSAKSILSSLQKSIDC